MIAVVGAGSNLGGRWSILRSARAVLRARGVTVEAVSPTYATPALVLPGAPPGPEFLNEAWRVRWDGSAEALLRRLLEVEALFGRTRERRWAARTLDLDILWSPRPQRLPHLRIPHPELTARPFALAPLLDVAPWLAARYGRHLRRRPRRGGGPTPLEAALARLHTTDAPAQIVRTLRLPAEPKDAAALVARVGLEPAATAVLTDGPQPLVLVAGRPQLLAERRAARRKS